MHKFSILDSLEGEERDLPIDEDQIIEPLTI